MEEMQIDDNVVGESNKTSKPDNRQQQQQVKDKVVAEYDVFLSTDLIRSLCLLQFPMRLAQRNNMTDIGQMKIKPRHFKMQLQLHPPERDNTFFSKDDDFGTFQQHTMESQALPMQTSYVIGVRRESSFQTEKK